MSPYTQRGGLLARYAPVGIVAAVLFLCGCGSSASSSTSSAGSGSSGAAPPTSTSAPTEPISPPPPQYAGLSSFERRCDEINRRGAIGRVVYDGRQHMTRGDTSPVTAAVTINPNAQPREVLQSTGATAGPPSIVTCSISAQLTASPYQFNVSDPGWQTRSFLTTDTASWVWYVGPKLGGTHTLLLSIRPIVAMRSTTSQGGYVSTSSSDIQQYEIGANVSVPWTERPAEIMSSIAANLKVAQGLVEATTALIVALVALAAALGFKRRSNRAPPSQVGSAAPGRAHSGSANPDRPA